MTFKIPQLTVSCCGCSLRTGVLIIGFINLVLSLFLAVIFLMEQIYRIVYSGIKLTEVEFVECELMDFTIFARLILCIFLLYGCFKDNPSYMYGFLLLHVAFIVMYIFFTVIYLFLHIMGIPSEEIFIYTFSTVLQCYCTVIVYSHYRNLKEGITIT